jgi:uncharacterized membrane protein YfcA
VEWYNYGLVFLAGAAGGIVNAISAAGSLITLPALQLAGLPPQIANATNRIGILTQNAAALVGFQKQGVAFRKEAVYMALATLPGGIIGAYFSIKIPEQLFNQILSVVLLIFLAMLIFFPIKVQDEEEKNDRVTPLSYILYFFSGMYGGFIQAGTGFLLMATTIYVNRFGLIKTNYFKVMAMLTYTIGAFAMFCWKAEINWVAGLILAAGNMVGAYFSSQYSVRAGEKWIRKAIIVVVCLMAAILWII